MQSTNIHWGDGHITLEPCFPDILLKKLKYWRRALIWSEEQMRRIATGQYEELYSVKSWIDEKTQQYNQSLLTMPGFMHRIKMALKEVGWSYKIFDERTPMPKPDMVAAMAQLRDYQVEAAYTAIVSGGGILSCPTGYGKTHLIGAIIKAFSPNELKARGTPLTVVTTPSKDITEKDYNDLKEMMPDRDIGLVMSGSNKFSEDIQVITLDSLHRLNPNDVGIIIVDEIHAAASDTRAESLLSFRKAARWGVSATPDGRFDGRDLVTEGLVGPVVYTTTYADGVKCGALVPITVYWLECPEPVMGIEKYLNFSSRAGRYRHGVLRNQKRNMFIGQLMQQLPKPMQAMCIMQFLEQMDHILPHCGTGMTIVHAETDATKIGKFKNLHSITPRERRDIYEQMESAEIKRILSTYVYRQGVNFPQLEVVINAGGGGSDIVAKQIPGRESRKTVDKSHSFLVDFWHPWDTVKDKRDRIVAGPVHADDQAREKAYTHLGFEQIWVKGLKELPFLQPAPTSVPASP